MIGNGGDLNLNKDVREETRMGSVVVLKRDGKAKNNERPVYKVGSKKQAKVIDIAVAGKKTNNESYLNDRQKEELIITYRLKARKLARSILRKWHARLDLQEVDSVVDLSLCEAVRRFNPTMGASFMTFLFYHLRGNLIRAVSSAASSHMIPLNDFEAVYAQRDEGSGDSSSMSRGVNAIEIAEALCGHDFPLPDEIVFKKELVDLSHKACSKLDTLAKEVISRIYIQGQQLIDIANSLGYSRCHISRVKKKALETLYQDLSSLMGLPADAPRPTFEEEESYTELNKSERKQIFRRRPRSKKAHSMPTKLAIGAGA